MQLLLVRHAEAASGSPDELRPLTPAGREQARTLGEQLRADGVEPTAILTSPLLRARETGALLARELGADTAVDGRLAPGATPERVAKAASERGGTVIAVGHQPDCSRIAAALTGRAGLPPGCFGGDQPRALSVIEVRGLRKSYGSVDALHGIDFAHEEGEVLALLGPNGAGKTTTVEILEGSRKRTAGEVRVLGEDPGRAGPSFRARIGIVLQSSAVYPSLSVLEMLELFAGYFPAPRDPDEVIRLVGLEEKRDVRVRTLSGGQLRRFDLGLALVGDPELIFLDEPTTGFDPAARRKAWETIRGLRELGKTVLLTTHYMEEAQTLADRVAILRAGRIVAIGPPAELLSGPAEVEISYRRNGQVVVLRTHEPTRVLNELTASALADGRELEGLQVTRRSLEDVYLELTADEPPE